MKSLTGFAFDVKYLTFKAQIHQIPRNLTENEPIYEIASEIQGYEKKSIAEFCSCSHYFLFN